MSSQAGPTRPVEQGEHDAGPRGMGAGRRFEDLRLEHRVLALIVYAVLLEIVSLVVLGSAAPFGRASTTWFFACLGLLAFSLLSAPIFAPPRDSLAAGIAGLLLLASMSLGPESGPGSPPVSPIGGALETFRWLGVAVQLVVVASAIAVVLPERGRPDRVARGKGAKRLARAVSRTFGQPEAMFAAPILVGILGHFQAQPPRMLWLLFLVTLIVVVRPVEAFVRLAAEWRAGGEGPAPPAERSTARERNDEPRHDDLAGRVVEGTTVGALRFEAVDDAEIRLGSIVVASASDRWIHYQVTGAETHEELGGTDGADARRAGSRVVTAVQLGWLAPDAGFRKHSWLPGASTPVFLARAQPAARDRAEVLPIGCAPATDFRVGLDLAELAVDHGAILGATGSGKTELALRLARGLLATEVRVLALDFTGELRAGLEAQEPELVRPAHERAGELEERLARAEGSKKEREALRSYLRSIEPALGSAVEAFLEDEGKALAVVALDDLPSPRAAPPLAAACLREVLRRATEPGDLRRIVVVIEEDHLPVLPAAAGTHEGNGEADALLERISEILHRGRKLGVGLLAVSRGTSAATRAVLAPCGTHVALHPVDPACLALLADVLGDEHARVLPDLPRRHAIAGGRAVGSETPLIVELASDPDALFVPASVGETDWRLA